jgi:hypothetical protein
MMEMCEIGGIVKPLPCRGLPLHYFSLWFVVRGSWCVVRNCWLSAICIIALAKANSRGDAFDASRWDIDLLSASTAAKSRDLRDMRN